MTTAAEVIRRAQEAAKAEDMRLVRVVRDGNSLIPANRQDCPLDYESSCEASSHACGGYMGDIHANGVTFVRCDAHAKGAAE